MTPEEIFQKRVGNLVLTIEQELVRNGMHATQLKAPDGFHQAEIDAAMTIIEAQGFKIQKLEDNFFKFIPPDYTKFNMPQS